ncbi:MAG: hypothetical protein R3A11_04960 [Bdellovibrionota bacterium]
MKKISKLFLTATIAMSLSFCGGSNESSLNFDELGTFDQSVANLKLVHYNVLRDRLITTMGLAEGDPAVILLDSRMETFLNTEISSTWITDHFKVMALACENTTLDLSSDAKLESFWQELTGEEMDSDAQSDLSEIMALSGYANDDQREAARCLFAMTSLSAIASNL